MGVTILTSPPRAVYDFSDIAQSLEFLYNRGLLDLVSASAPGTYDIQTKYQYGISYRVDNEGAMGVVSGVWNIEDSETQGDFSAFIDSQSQNNSVGLTPQPAAFNLFSPPERSSITNTVTDLTITTGVGHAAPTHIFTFSEPRLASMTALVREANLQSLIDTYPNGTITFRNRFCSSSSYRWDIHAGYAVVSILSSRVITDVEATFPLSDFGLEPTLPPNPNPEECACDWTALNPVPSTTWESQASVCATFTLDPLPVTAWTKRGCP
jgi:hypothetical protein